MAPLNRIQSFGGELVRVLYGVSPIGLGHASRAVVVVPLLTAGGAEVFVYSGAKASEFMWANGVESHPILSEPGLAVSDGEMKRVTLWYARSWLALKRDGARIEKVISSFRPDVVVCDEEFSGMQAAARRGTKRVLMSDELELGFARSWPARQVESRVSSWYEELQKSVDLLLVPEWGIDSENRRFVGPIVRKPTRTRAEVLREYRLPEGRMVLVSLSGSGIGAFLVDLVLRGLAEAGIEDGFVVVTGNRGRPVRGERVYDLGVTPRNQDLVAAADLVVSLAGKSTIDEAAASGTPIVAIPVRHHAEQERNAAALGYSSEDRGKIADLLGSKIGRREAPREFPGGENASRLILAMT